MSTSPEGTGGKQNVLERIREAFRIYCRSEIQEGRGQLEAIWAELQPDGNAFARCLAAHYLADTESDPQKALEWDLKALEIAQSVPLEEEHPSDPTAAAVKTFYPSLYLSVADGYRKVGDFTSARRHVKEGTAWSAVLGLDAYGQRVRAELLRVAAQIDESDSGPSVVFDYD